MRYDFEGLFNITATGWRGAINGLSQSEQLEVTGATCTFPREQNIVGQTFGQVVDRDFARDKISNLALKNAMTDYH